MNKKDRIRRIVGDKSYMENCSTISCSERNLYSDLYEMHLRNPLKSGNQLCFPSIFEVINNGLERFKLNCLLSEQIKRWRNGEQDLSLLQRNYWNEKRSLERLALPC